MAPRHSFLIGRKEKSAIVKTVVHLEHDINGNIEKLNNMSREQVFSSEVCSQAHSSRISRCLTSQHQKAFPRIRNVSNVPGQNFTFKWNSRSSVDIDSAEPLRWHSSSSRGTTYIFAYNVSNHHKKQPSTETPYTFKK